MLMNGCCMQHLSCYVTIFYLALILYCIYFYFIWISKSFYLSTYILLACQRGYCWRRFYFFMKHFYFLMRGRNVGTVPTILLPLKRHTPLHHHIITTVISSHEFHPLEPGLAHSREGAVRTGTRLHFYLKPSTTHYTTPILSYWPRPSRWVIM